MVTIGLKTAQYSLTAITDEQKIIQKIYPGMFKFEALSVGDKDGQAFIIPLDESSRETAELIIRAISAYKGE